MQETELPSPSPRKTPRRRLELAALAGFAFVACFAEPKDSAPNGGETPGTGGVGGSGTTSSGGRAPATGGTPQAAGQAGESAAIGGAGATEGGGDANGGEGNTSTFCNDVAAEPLPARRAITSNAAPPPDTGPKFITLTKESLYNDFVKQTCGTNECHGGVGDPLAKPDKTFRVTLENFDTRPTLGEEALERILSADEDEWMPPGGGDGSKRDENNPIRKLGEHLLAWQKAGFPASFTLALASSSSGDVPTDPYLLSPELGKRLTNIGSCIPNALAMLNPVGAGLDQYTREMQKKDGLFADMQTSDDLPDTLYETDLVSLSSVELGFRHVFSYAPTYPLYSDHAGKMRYVRVPLGESIHYDAALHDFVIPDNTRFYKTFLKEVKDKDKKVGWRKMETRLIVVRQDEQLPDGSYKTHALRASYAWDKNETMAHRVKDPFRDGTPAADRLCPYVVDESVKRDPVANPINSQVDPTVCEYMTAAEMQDANSGQLRHYAIPSTQRCDQCHMGSSSHSYILGFTPWQVDRRKSGEGGIYEEPTDDQLTQLQRFIDYGIVTGIEPGKVKLEESQLIADPPRGPRNDYELKAQGYMMGNCAFCHNPHGYPVVTNPVLREFELFPSETGGIFQFSLEHFSPRAKAGAAQAHLRPYITPALGDSTLAEVAAPEINTPSKLLEINSSDPFLIDALKIPPPPDVLRNNDTGTILFEFLGPWRSMIWRNVYTPFTYAEDSTIFIHMPRNAAGYDCRAHQIMAQWMLSIPSLLKPGWDREDQPMYEVFENQPNKWDQAFPLVKQRLDGYAASVTGSWCPPDDDIIDPKVTPPDPVTHQSTRPNPLDEGISSPRIDPNNTYINTVRDAVPDHAHWVSTDTTEIPGKWTPRRSDWKSVIATREVEVSEQENQVLDDLQQVHLTPALKDFALEPLPMGLWDQRCQNTAEAKATPTVADLVPNHDLPLHRWLSGHVVHGDTQPADSTAHVHSQSRGEAVFRAICQNCHGKAIDSKSALSATISELTGGQTRVANFVDGLFGPASAPGAYAHDEFAIGYGATPDDWQARYVLFMGLGGTRANIPLAVLNLVAASGFYGQPVVAPGADNPNMLGSAQLMCAAVLNGKRLLPSTREENDPPPAPIFGGTFAPGTGHYELWESLCTFQNEPVVRAFILEGTDYTSNQTVAFRAKDEGGNWIYPPTALVGNQLGQVEVGIQPTNLMPWCIATQYGAATTEGVTAYWTTKLGLPVDSIPFCPDPLFAQAFGNFIYHLAVTSSGTADHSVPFGNADFVDRWTRHGAINAGLSAFQHMRGFTYGDVEQSHPFDFCAQ